MHALSRFYFRFEEFPYNPLKKRIGVRSKDDTIQKQRGWVMGPVSELGTLPDKSKVPT